MTREEIERLLWQWENGLLGDSPERGQQRLFRALLDRIEALEKRLGTEPAYKHCTCRMFGTDNAECPVRDKCIAEGKA